MWHKVNWMVLAAALAVLALGRAAQADAVTHGTTTINMEFVTVGNAGNTADDTGYGAVGYKYQIGKHEVTADHWAAVIAADPNVGNAGDWSGSQPTAGTSWHEAAKFCNWLTTGSANSGYYTISGGEATPNALGHDAYAAAHGTTYFIPTENEWYKAAYHKNNGVTGGASNYWEYPTGSDSVPVGIRNPQVPAFDAVFSDWYNQGHPNDVTNAGVASPYSTIGQGGNVWEWNETAIGSSRGLRGGYWGTATPPHFLLAASYRSDGRYPTYEYDGVIGFRVASSEAVPEPGSVAALLGIAVMGLIWRWRRK